MSANVANGVCAGHTRISTRVNSSQSSKGSSGSTSRAGLRGARRHGRADHDDPDRGRGPRPRRADAAQLRPPRRPVQPVRRRDAAATGRRLHVVIPDITRAHWQVNIRKFVVKRRPARRPRRGWARSPPQAAATSSRPPSWPGSTSSSPAARRPARRRCSTAWPPRSRSRERVVTCEEVFELKIPLRDVGEHAVPPAQPRGHRRGAAAPPGQGGAADAPVAHHRRRGAPGREPRPAHRAQQRSAGHVHDPRQLAPARRSRRCARCRCSPARTCRPRFVVPTVAAVGRHRRARSPSSPTARDGSARSSACPGGSRATSSRSPTCSSPRSRPAHAGRRLPAAPGAVRASWVRRRGPAGPGGLVTALLLGLLSASGCSASTGRSGRASPAASAAARAWLRGPARRRAGPGRVRVGDPWAAW